MSLPGPPAIALSPAVPAIESSWDEPIAFSTESRVSAPSPVATPVPRPASTSAGEAGEADRVGAAGAVEPFEFASPASVSPCGEPMMPSTEPSASLPSPVTDEARRSALIGPGAEP